MKSNRNTLDMKTADKTDENIELIAQIFPNVMSEGKIDFDLLKQMISKDLIDTDDERYRLDWVGKKASLLKVNRAINKTLRPSKEESVNFDTTQNLYIEGDNFEVLKLIQESYLNKVKMIYIDPPYNTGKDFVYRDNFTQSKNDYENELGIRDDENNKLFKNTDTNGRFHSDWLSMMYERLLVSRDLLKDDGVIFISIDDNEVHNLRKLCDEVFGEGNFVALLPTVMNLKGNNDQYAFSGTHEYTMVYSKSYTKSKFYELYASELEIKEWKKDEYGLYKKGANLKATGINAPRHKRPNLYFPIYIDKNNNVLLEKCDGYIQILPKTDNVEMSWRWSKEKFKAELHNLIIIRNEDKISIYKKQRSLDDEKPTKKPKSLFYSPEYSSGNGTQIIKKLFNNKVFDFPKPISLIFDFLTIGTKNNDIILDFFSGSATTAHSVMQLNAEDGGDRKYICVQIQEKTDEKSEAYKAGYKNICEIGKERIRRAGKKIVEDNKDTKGIEKLDIGFRVLKVDSSNMKDVYYNPKELLQENIFNYQSNIKDDRTDLDLLFQIMLDLGIELSLTITPKIIDNTTIYLLENKKLIACFTDNISLEVIEEIDRLAYKKVVLKDSCFSNDEIKINTVEKLSKNSTVSVL